MSAQGMAVAWVTAALVWSVLLSHQAHASQTSTFTRVESADFVLHNDRRPPGDKAAWQPISLPDQWRERMPEGIRSFGWYRIKLQFEREPSLTYAVGITHPRAFRTDFFVNGKFIGGAGDVIAGRRASPRTELSPAFGTPLYLTIPPSLLRKGDNIVQVRVNATSAGTYMHGLPQVVFGEPSALRSSYQFHNETGFSALRAFFAMALTCGLITFFLWLARRDDKVLFWYSMACLVWGLVSIPRLALRWIDAVEPLIPFLTWFLNYGLVVPVVVMCLRNSNLKWPKFEAGLWVFLATEVTFPFWGALGQWGLVWDAVNTVLLLASVAIVARFSRRPFRWSVQLQIVALLLMAALMSFELMRYLGWIYIDLKAVRHYHVPLMLFAIGAVIFERHALAVQRTEQANVELEQRVADRTREVEVNYARMEAALREHALVRQRQRILRDLHDGLGASLIGLSRRLPTTSQHAGLQSRVREALLEMKVAVDALQPRENDLASVFGNFRLRIEEMIDAAGMRLSWETDELPALVGLRPTIVFEVQRILLEAIANVLKHSGATRIRFTAHAHAAGEIRIEIADDGRGFDALNATAGLGLRNMRNRAARIGARLCLRSGLSGGTAVELILPSSGTSADTMPAFSEAPVRAAGGAL